MTVVMEVADDGNAYALLRELIDDRSDGCGGLFVIDGDTNQFGARACQRRNLLDSRGDVRGIGVRHGLHDDRVS